MENPFLQALLLGLLAGAGGTTIGALAALLIKHLGKRLSCVLLGLAGGIMLAIAILDMLPEAWESGGLWPSLIGLLVGAVLVYFISKGTHHEQIHEAEGVDPGVVREHDLLRTGLLLAAGISVHNLPQGLAIGAGVTTGIAGSLTFLLLLHNVPEGMAMAMPLRIGRVAPGKIMGVVLLTAIPTVVGALIGVAVAEISGAFVAASMAFAAGAMIYLTIAELIPQAASFGNTVLLILAAAGGFGLGALFIWMLEG